MDDLIITKARIKEDINKIKFQVNTLFSKESKNSLFDKTL